MPSMLVLIFFYNRLDLSERDPVIKITITLVELLLLSVICIKHVVALSQQIPDYSWISGNVVHEHNCERRAFLVLLSEDKT